MATILETNTSPTMHAKLVLNTVTEDGLTPVCWYGNTDLIHSLKSLKKECFYGNCKQATFGTFKQITNVMTLCDKYIFMVEVS